MDAIYLLIPIAILLAALAIAIFFWAVRSGQFDDLEGPAHKILMEDKGRSDNDQLKNNGSGND